MKYIFLCISLLLLLVVVNGGTVPDTKRAYEDLANVIGSLDSKFHIITMRAGVVHSTFKNKNLQVNGMKLFFTSDGTQPSIIDCGANGKAFNISNSEITFYNIIFRNCSGSFGGAIQISDESTVFLEKVTITNITSDFGAIHVSKSKLYTTDTSFVNNVGFHDGPAIFATHESIVEIEKTTFVNNRRSVLLNNKKVFLTTDISVKKGANVLYKDTQANTILSTCDSDSKFIDNNGVSLCSRTYQPASTLLGSCGDKICDPVSEDFFNCPSDCNSTHFSGFLHQEYQCETFNKTKCQSLSRSPLTFAKLIPFENQDSVNGFLMGTLETFFNTPRDANIYFKFNIDNINLYVNLDNTPILEFDGSQNNVFYGDHDLVVSKYLISDHVHKLEIKYEVISNILFGNRLLEIQYSYDGVTYQPFQDGNFYSRYVCGDGVYDQGEKCISDTDGGYGSPYSVEDQTKVLNSTCGNGICDEVDPNTCLYDCYRYITTRCAPYSLKKNALSPMVTNLDTLGSLILNQIVWRLPGYQHLSFGYDIVFGEQRSFPIFYFGFCNDKESNIVEDRYRQAFYEIPKEMSVVPLPKCTFDVSSKFHSTSQSMRLDMQKETSWSTSAGASGGIGAIDASVNVAFSKEKSVKIAVEMESKQTGTLIETNIDCYITSVKLNEFQFSLNFLKDISNSITVDDFFNLIKIYGTHYYDSAILGGQLKQVVSIKETEMSSQRKREVSEQTAKSVSVKVSSPKFSVNSDYSDSHSESTSEEAMNKYKSSTTKTSIEARGGAPGTYGSDSNSFGDWADTIDLLPIPIKPKFKRIALIIPETWITPLGQRVVDLWVEAENRYYDIMGDMVNTKGSTAKDKSRMLWFSGVGTDNGVFNGQTPEVVMKSFSGTSLSSRIDFNAIPTKYSRLSYDYFDFKTFASQGFYEKEFVIVEPPFEVDWDPESYHNVLQTNLKVPATQFSINENDLNRDISVIKNMVFLSSDNKQINLRSNYLWEAPEYPDRSMADFPIWSAYFFQPNGSMYAPKAKDIGFLIIPGLAIGYNHLAINIHTGGYNTVIYVRMGYNVLAYHKAMISLPKSQLAKILVATSIDYTPNYDFFDHLGADYSWYDDSGPRPDNWYWRHAQKMEGLFAALDNDDRWDDLRVCPMAINYDRSCYILDCESSAKPEHITGVYVPTSELTYFFLPNIEGKYLMIKIAGSNTACGKDGYTNSVQKIPKSFAHVTETIDRYAMGRLHTKQTWGRAQYGEPKDFNENWWAGVIVPAENFIPEVLPSA